MNDRTRENHRNSWVPIIFLTIGIYLIVMCNLSSFSGRCVFWMIYLLFNIIIILSIAREIYKDRLNKNIIIFLFFSIFNAITYFHPYRFMVTIHSGNYLLPSLLCMILPAFLGVIISLFLMYGVVNSNEEDLLMGLTTILFLIFSSAFFFSIIYGYTYEEFFHGGYDLFVDMHESAIGNAKNQAILCENFLLYSFDCMLGRNYSNIELSFINLSEMQNSIQYAHIGSYGAANRWLFGLKVVSELESFIFVIYISFIIAEMLKHIIKRKS